MILVFVLLHLCNFLLVSTHNLGNITEERSEAGYELNGDHVQEDMVTSYDPVVIQTLLVGAGDATIIECPLTISKEFSLIDMGSRYWAHGAMTNVNYVTYIEDLMGHGQKQLKHIFLTHPDMDHLNYGYEQYKRSLLKLLVDTYPPKQVTIHLSSWENWKALKGKNHFLDNFLAYLDTNKGHFIWKDYDPTDENVIDICGNSPPYFLPSGVNMKIIAADLGITNVNTNTDTNAMSMVMSLSYQGPNENMVKKMLFMGDFQGIDQYWHLTNNYRYRQYLPANVVMVPHHGASTHGNADPLFYEMVNAEHAIISSHIGYLANRHPKLKTLASICKGIDMIDEEPYYLDICDVNLSYCRAMYGMGMAQGHGTMESWNLRNPGNALCGRNIHQTTKMEIEIDTDWFFVHTFIVKTKLYPDKNPDVESKEWHPSNLF